MHYSTLILTFVAGLALCECRSSGVAAKSVATNSATVSEMITKAQTDIMKFGTDLHEVLIRPNQEAVVNALKERSTAFVNNIQSYMEKMGNDLKSKGPEITKMWDELKNTMTKAADDISAQIPVAKDQVSKLEKKFVEGMGAIVKQSELVMKTVKADAEPIKEDVANLAKKAVELALKATTDLKAQIEERMPKISF